MDIGRVHLGRQGIEESAPGSGKDPGTGNGHRPENRIEIKILNLKHRTIGRGAAWLSWSFHGSSGSPVQPTVEESFAISFSQAPKPSSKDYLALEGANEATKRDSFSAVLWLLKRWIETASDGQGTLGGKQQPGVTVTLTPREAEMMSGVCISKSSFICTVAQ
jgi:hypothetical protein